MWHNLIQPILPGILTTHSFQVFWTRWASHSVGLPLSPVRRSDGRQRPPVQQVWERVKRPQRRSRVLPFSFSFGRRLRLTSISTWRDVISPPHQSVWFTRLIISTLTPENWNETLFCLSIPVLSFACWPDVESCFKSSLFFSFFFFPKWSHDLSLFTILVWYWTAICTHSIDLLNKDVCKGVLVKKSSYNKVLFEKHSCFEWSLFIDVCMCLIIDQRLTVSLH